MVKVHYGFKTNAYLGGVLFIEGIAEFADNAEGIKFAEMFKRKYEVIEEDKPTAKRKVKK